MAMRMTDVPVGGARIAYAVLATVLAALGGALVSAVVWPIVTTEQTCATDPTGWCTPALGLVMVTLGFWFVMTWLAVMFRLGWVFVLLVVVGQLVCGQLAVEWVSGWPLLAGLLLVIPLAAWLSTPGALVGRTGAGTGGPVATSRVPLRRLLVLVACCAVLVVQLGVWTWTFLR